MSHVVYPGITDFSSLLSYIPVIPLPIKYSNNNTSNIISQITIIAHILLSGSIFLCVLVAIKVNNSPIIIKVAMGVISIRTNIASPSIIFNIYSQLLMKLSNACCGVLPQNA